MIGGYVGQRLSHNDGIDTHAWSQLSVRWPRGYE